MKSRNVAREILKLAEELVAGDLPKPGKEAIANGMVAVDWAKPVWDKEPEMRLVSVNELSPAEDDTKNAEKVALFAKLYKEAPERVSPIIARAKQGQLAIVDGHKRLAGAKQAGMSKVWAQILSY